MISKTLPKELKIGSKIVIEGALDGIESAHLDLIPTTGETVSLKGEVSGSNFAVSAPSDSLAAGDYKARLYVKCPALDGILLSTPLKIVK